MREPEALARWHCPFPLHTHDVLRQLRIIRVLLDLLRAERHNQDWHFVIMDTDRKVTDPYRTVLDSPNDDIPIMRVVDEDPSPGPKASQRLTPAAAAACGDVTELPRIIPGAILVGTEHHIIVNAIPLTRRAFRLL